MAGFCGAHETRVMAINKTNIPAGILLFTSDHSPLVCLQRKGLMDIVWHL